MEEEGHPYEEREREREMVKQVSEQTLTCLGLNFNNTHTFIARRIKCNNNHLAEHRHTARAAELQRACVDSRRPLLSCITHNQVSACDVVSVMWPKNNGKINT